MFCVFFATVYLGISNERALLVPEVSSNPLQKKAFLRFADYVQLDLIPSRSERFLRDDAEKSIGCVADLESLIYGTDGPIDGDS